MALAVRALCRREAAALRRMKELGASINTGLIWWTTGAQIQYTVALV